ncbi:unnamed protein product [Polarella glacialis]|uniref:Uncharacterized protein n=1 Tax=Polarella glacialis TaxID=89957 RepID=A0A813GKF5_POLGL|nr:unnamed protein product [Polarella glacialis]
MASAALRADAPAFVPVCPTRPGLNPQGVHFDPSLLSGAPGKGHLSVKDVRVSQELDGDRKQELVGDRLIRELANALKMPSKEKPHAREQQQQQQQQQEQQEQQQQQQERGRPFPTQGLFCPFCCSGLSCAFHSNSNNNNNRSQASEWSKSTIPGTSNFAQRQVAGDFAPSSLRPSPPPGLDPVGQLPSKPWFSRPELVSDASTDAGCSRAESYAGSEEASEAALSTARRPARTTSWARGPQAPR